MVSIGTAGFYATAFGVFLRSTLIVVRLFYARQNPR